MQNTGLATRIGSLITLLLPSLFGTGKGNGAAMSFALQADELKA